MKGEDLKHKHPQAGIFFFLPWYIAVITSIIYEFQLAYRMIWYSLRPEVHRGGGKRKCSLFWPFHVGLGSVIDLWDACLHFHSTPHIQAGNSACILSLFLTFTL